VRFGYVVRPKADRDIEELADYLAEHAGLDTALLFLSEAYRTLILLATQPEIGWQCKVTHPQPKTARTFRVSDRFEEYLIFYQPFENHIEIWTLGRCSANPARLIDSLKSTSARESPAVQFNTTLIIEPGGSPDSSLKLAR